MSESLVYTLESTQLQVRGGKRSEWGGVGCEWIGVGVCGAWGGGEWRTYMFYYTVTKVEYVLFATAGSSTSSAAV